MRDIAKALACAHGEGVVHRDIKPENVLISGGTAVVADFGIAKAISAVRTGSHGVSSELAVTADGISLGTPAYMAPEQVAGDPDVGPATDVYAFGVVAYEMLAGVHPFAGKKSLAALMKAHVVEQPRHIMEQRPDLPPELAGLVMRCLEKEPAARPGNGSELLLALDALDASLGVASKPAVPRDKMPVPANAARRSSREPVNPAAFELYQRGRHLVEQRSDGMHEALSCFEQAIELDPNFSAPHAGISMVLTLFAAYHALSPRAAFPRARESAERALAIDPTDALALVMRAHTALWYEWDFQRAETLTRRALELAPGLYLAHDCLGFVLAARAQFDEAISAMERARVLDPHDNATYDLAWILLLAGRWEQAIRDLEPALEKHPRASELRRVLGFCLFYAGHRQEGLAEFRRVLKLHLDDRWGSLNIVQVLAALGEVDEARRLVRSIEERARHEPIPPLGIAIMHHALGDDEIALDWLERSLEARDFWLVMLPFDPSMIGLRDHPRFIRVMERVRGSAG
jgi:tetratricopeptide (TPR) repeat protein